MCVIVIKPENTNISREDIEAMYKQNPHGVGISYLDKNKNLLIWQKGLTDWDEIEKIVNELYSVEAIVHFRYGTSGPNNAIMCQTLEKCTQRIYQFETPNHFITDYQCFITFKM